jgi:hypothetical protein
MSILKNLFGKKENKSACCNIQFVEVKKEETQEQVQKEEKTNSSSCCQS